MNDDDKNNAVQDNQVSSTGQNNSPPSEFFKEDSLDDLGKYISVSKYYVLFTIQGVVYWSLLSKLLTIYKFCEMNFV